MNTPKNEQAVEAPCETTKVAPKTILAPRIDVGEDANEYVIVANTPGSSQENIEVSFVDQTMKLVAKVDAPNDEKMTAKRLDFQIDEYQQSFDLDVCNFDIDRVTAVYENGILTIRLPKVEASKPRKIEVKVAQ